MLSIESQLLENANEIKQSLVENGVTSGEKKKFYDIVKKVKINAIKSDKLLDVIQELRTTFVNDWRPKQHSIISGIILWSVLIVFGSFLIHFRDWDFLILNPLLSMIMNGVLVFIGWFFINLGVHNLGHYIAGKLVAIDYNSWVTFNFFGQWALIIDYKSYLKATFNERQFVHISGPFCTLATPWIIYFIIWHPLMLGLAIYMVVASLPLIFKKGWDYGRIFREFKLKQQYKQNLI